VDEYTRRMAGALRVAELDPWLKRTRGHHTCVCRMDSSNSNHYVRTESGHLITNSLAVHYLAHHRSEVPEGELAKSSPSRPHRSTRSRGARPRSASAAAGRVEG